MTSAAKVKGNKAERDACKILQKIFNQPFQRVPSSDAMLGGLNNPKAKSLSKNQQQILSNDIIPPDCFQNLSIEIKSRIDFLFHKIYSKETPNENILEVVYYDMQKLFLHLGNTLLRYSNLSQLPAYYISHL